MYFNRTVSWILDLLTALLEYHTVGNLGIGKIWQMLMDLPNFNCPNILLLQISVT